MPSTSSSSLSSWRFWGPRMAVLSSCMRRWWPSRARCARMPPWLSSMTSPATRPGRCWYCCTTRSEMHPGHNGGSFGHRLRGTPGRACCSCPTSACSTPASRPNPSGTAATRHTSGTSAITWSSTSPHCAGSSWRRCIRRTSVSLFPSRKARRWWLGGTGRRSSLQGMILSPKRLLGNLTCATRASHSKRLARCLGRKTHMHQL
mmetsp:Transcript_76076/g.209900  ORF Transcript_76076/g.209900 Transcript_76076/m.209900 type:complete len:204 (+) Transcript_76076:250-861(+)